MTTLPAETPDVPSDQPAALQRWWYFAPRQLVVLVFWCILFGVLNRTTLHEPELWGQAAYGRWMLDNRTLPPEDPFLPLSGKPLLANNWLGQVILGWVASQGGEPLSALLALTMLAAYALLARSFYLACRHTLIAHLGVLLVALIGWDRSLAGRPEAFGYLCFALLLWLLARDRFAGGGSGGAAPRERRHRWDLWLGIPVLMAVWTNLHWSFVCGLLLLTCWAVGTVIEAAWRQRSLVKIWTDRAVRRWCWLWELGLAATCLNPHGVFLVVHTLGFADRGPVQDLPALRLLLVLVPSGLALVSSLFALMWLLRHSRRSMPVADALMIVAFSGVIAQGHRFAWWYAAVFGFVASPLIADAVRRGLRMLAGSGAKVASGASQGWLGLPATQTWSYTLVGLILIWICLAVSPAGSLVGTRDPRAPADLYGDSVPWRISAHLRDDPRLELVFAPDWWGDWLAWDGPVGISLFTTSQASLLPRQAWIDYRIVRETRTGWQNILTRYGVGTVVLDNRAQTTLLRYLRASKEDWEVVYEDATGTVFGRVPTEQEAENW